MFHVYLMVFQEIVRDAAVDLIAMDFRPRNVGKGKGRAEPPRNRYHPGFSAPPSAAATADSGSSIPVAQSAAASSTSTVSHIDDPELAAKKEAQAAAKVANVAKKAAEAQRQSDRIDAEVVGLLELSLSDWAVDHGGTGLRMKLKSAELGCESYVNLALTDSSHFTQLAHPNFKGAGALASNAPTAYSGSQSSENQSFRLCRASHVSRWSVDI